MLKQQLRKKEDQGFTIIEVLIVLAIAGLILLIVFLAVPALQRNARNTQRSNDVAGMIGAWNEYNNNTNGGAPPTGNCLGAASGATPACGFLVNVKTGFYGAGGWTSTNFIYTDLGSTYAAMTGAQKTAAILTENTVTDTNTVFAASYESCNGTGTAAVAGAGPRNSAFTYLLETGSGGTTEICKTAG